MWNIWNIQIDESCVNCSKRETTVASCGDMGESKENTVDAISLFPKYYSLSGLFHRDR